MVAELSIQMTEVLKQLRTQFERIAQIQLQLDRLAAGESPEPSDRRATKRTNN